MIEVALLIYPQCQLAAIHGLTDLFRIANERSVYPSDDHTGRLMRVSHWQENGATGALDCVWDSLPGAPHQPAFAIAPPSVAMPEDMGAMPSAARWLGELHAQGTIICSVCAGAFVVAQTGLMSGRRVTTHWAFAGQLAARHPEIRVTTDNVVIDDGDLISAGAILAWNDLGLLIVERVMGSSVMLATSRFMLSDGLRGDQRPFEGFSPRLNHDDAPVLAAQHHIHAHPAEPHSIPSLSDRAGLTERTFLRRFQKATGLRPTDYVKRVRIMKARDALQLGDLSISLVAESVGYEDPNAFRKAFQSLVGLSPKAFRDRFRLNRERLAAASADDSGPAL